MRLKASVLLLATLCSGCASYEALPDARGAIGPKQRLVLNVSISPGPWIVDASDSKVETAAKLLPVGFLMQSVQDEHNLSVSKDMQQYMPRPHYGLAVQNALLSALRTARSTDTVQTVFEAGISAAQLTDWNRAKDQLDWRQRYYNLDPAAPAPRDYARALTLDDAMILDVNVSYGTIAADDGQIEPEMSADSRVYRGDTSRLIWEHEDEVVDKTSTSTLSEFKLYPSQLTDRIEKLAPQLAATIAASVTKSFGLTPSAPPRVSGSTTTVAGSAPGGLLPLSYLQNLSSTTVAAVSLSTPTVAVDSTTIVVSTPAVSVSTSPAAH